jgi:predicted GNAT family N-acyltransferase
MDFCIKQPETDKEFKEYYHLRWKLLRAPWNQPEGSEIDDIEDQCFHIMAVSVNENKEDKVIGVARLQFNTDSEAQVRYMAVAEEQERKGVGRELMNAMESHACSTMCKHIVLDAREPAVAFYQKLGYRLIEKSYLLFGEIQHFRMHKEL